MVSMHSVNDSQSDRELLEQTNGTFEQSLISLLQQWKSVTQ